MHSTDAAPTGRPTWLTHRVARSRWCRGRRTLRLHAKLGEGAQPVFQEATNCRSAFVNAVHQPPVKDRIGSEEAHYRVDVTLIHSLKRPPRELSRVGSRGLLGASVREYCVSEADDGVADLDLVAGAEFAPGRRRGGVDVGAVGGAEVIDGDFAVVREDARRGGGRRRSRG